MRKILFSILLLASPALADTPGEVTVHGKVHDQVTGKGVAGVSVYRQETDETAITDDDGNFTFTPGPGGRSHLTIVDPSYARADVVADGGKSLDVALAPVSLQGEEIVVEAEAPHVAAGQVSLTTDELEHSAGSHNDPLLAIKNLPSIANTGLGIGQQQGLVIRGSSPADSRVFVDGFAIPILYHLGGIQSILPTEMIDSIDVQPGNYGVELGGASGGIVNVNTHEGARDWKGVAEVSFINAQGMLQGPVGKDGSFAIAARRSYIDGVIAAVVPSSSSLSFTALPRYYDYQARFDDKLSPHWKLRAFILGSDDTFAIATDAENPDDPAASGQFSNTTSFTRGIASLTYDTQGFTNQAAVSVFTQAVGFDIGSTRHLNVGNTGAAVRDQARLALTDTLSVVAGGEAELVGYDLDIKIPRPPHEGDPSVPSFTYDPLIVTKQSGDGADAAAWTALDAHPVPWLSATAGVRVDDFHRNHVVVAQPRVNARVQLAPSVALLAATGLYTRPPTDQDENLQTDLEPERAWQSSLGAETKVGDGVSLATTAYYIDRSDMVVQRTDRTGAMSSDGSDTYDNAGVGRSYGAEFLLKAHFADFFGWVAYTYASSDRQDHPMDAWRKFDTDQTHNLIALASYKPTPRWQLGARFQYTSGTPDTPVVGAVFDSDRNSYTPTYGATNSLRNASQNQLDLRVDHYWTFTSWKLSAYLDVSNVYLNAPVQGYQYNQNYTTRTAITGIPILPSLGVRGEF